MTVQLPVKYNFSDNLLNGKSTFPGRPRRYLENPELGLLPHSCVLTKYDGRLARLMQLTSQDLRGGAGVKVVLDSFKNRPQLDFEWYFYLPSTHPDFDKITEYQSQYLWSKPKELSEGYSWLKVADSMECSEFGKVSIEESWELFIYWASHSKARIIVDLSELRPSGSVNAKGLTATGAVGNGSEDANTGSFFAIYDALARHLKVGDIKTLLQLLGTINNTIRRGGLYKNGIVTSSMRYDNPYIFEYLNANIEDIPGSHKKSIRLDSGVFDNPTLVNLIVKKRETESLFFEKIDPLRPDLFLNVCVGLEIRPRGTCLINRVNIAQCTKLTDIIDAFRDATEQLCHLHINWRAENPEKAQNYIPLEQDNQIGVCILGFANYLKQERVSYQDFVDALEMFLEGKKIPNRLSKAASIVAFLALAYSESARVADEIMDGYGLPRLARIHTVEPAQSHAYECKDLEGKTTARGIFAPYGRKVLRKSESQKQKIYNHGAVETAAELGADLHERLCNLWQRLMNEYGRPHAISFDTRKPCTVEWLKWFLSDSCYLKSAYYEESGNFDQGYLDKVAQTAYDFAPALPENSEDVPSNGFCVIGEDREGECSVCAE